MSESKKIKSKNQQVINVLLIIAIFIVAIFYASILYFDRVHTKPENVFWGMISQNLQTGSMSRSSEQTASGQKLTQLTEMQFKSKLVAKNSVRLTTESGNNTSVVANEAIGTANADILRYTALPTKDGKAPENVINVWAMQTKENSGQDPSILADNILATPLMFGYLNSTQRSSIVNELKNSGAITVDFSTVDKNAKYENKKVYSYDITLNLDKYITAYNMYLKDIGQGVLSENLSMPPAGSTYPIKILVNPVSYQPVSNELGNKTEKLFNFNLDSQLQIPKNVTTTISEIKSRLSE